MTVGYDSILADIRPLNFINTTFQHTLEQLEVYRNMLRLKFTGVLLAAVMVVGISGIATSAASAAVFTLTTEKCTGGTFFNLCYEKAATELFELSGSQSVTVANLAGNTAIFKVPSLGVEVLCTTVTGSGTALQASPLKENGLIEGTLTFKSCSLDKELGELCSIPVEKETLPLIGELTSEKILLLKPKTGTTFIELPFTNKTGKVCPETVAGNHKITGEQEVEIEKPGTAETTKTGKSIAVNKLKFSSAAATLESTLVLSFTGLGDSVYVSKEA